MSYEAVGGLSIPHEVKNPLEAQPEMTAEVLIRLRGGEIQEGHFALITLHPVLLTEPGQLVLKVLEEEPDIMADVIRHLPSPVKLDLKLSMAQVKQGNGASFSVAIVKDDGQHLLFEEG